MTDKTFNGQIKAKVVETRFPFSGKVVKVLKNTGDTVGKNQLLASLDQKLLQIELDRQLADYEKIRADFEIFNLKNPQISDDLTKYLKSGKQSQLNKSVKEVELAKERLDQANLYSPIEGIIIDDSNITQGAHITPSLASFLILDTSSFYFEIKIDQEDIFFFEKEKQAEIKLTNLEKTILGKTKPIFANGKKFILKVELENKDNLLLGLRGKASFKNS